MSSIASRYKWIVALGDLDNGFSFIGPYDSPEAAIESMRNDPTVEAECTYTVHELGTAYTQETWGVVVAAHEARRKRDGE
jgi:hypothetical protein